MHNSLSLHEIKAINIVVKKGNSIAAEHMYDVIHIEIIDNNNDTFTVSTYGTDNIDIPIHIQVKTNKE